MQTVVVAMMIAFFAQGHAKETTNVEDLLANVDMNELVNKMVDKLSQRLNLEDTDMDSTTLGKPGAMATQARPVVSPVLADRRAIAGGIALMPLVAVVGGANAADKIPNYEQASENAYISALLENTKNNKAANDAKRAATQAWNGKRFGIMQNRKLKDATPDLENAIPWVPNVPTLGKRDMETLKRATR